MGYPTDILTSRAIVRPGKFALIPPEGLVNNVIPGFEGCEISILMSPKIGASFVQYVVTMNPGGQNMSGFGGSGIETFVYCMDGQVKVMNESGETHLLETGGYFYCPPDDRMRLLNESETPARLFLYKQKYEPLPGHKPWSVVGNANDLEGIDYDNMKEVNFKSFLPSDLGFDMNIHILTFSSPACHPFVETHVQEHGAYILSGEGMYNLDNEWMPVKKGDAIWFGPFVPQAAYSVGRDKLSYIYSKDCNRDVQL